MNKLRTECLTSQINASSSATPYHLSTFSLNQLFRQTPRYFFKTIKKCVAIKNMTNSHHVHNKLTKLIFPCLSTCRGNFEVGKIRQITYKEQWGVITHLKKATACFIGRVPSLFFVFNFLTPELNSSAQRCLRRIFTGNFASWTVHFVNICVKTQQMQQLFTQFINYVC
jgi:hypothetical protein